MDDSDDDDGNGGFHYGLRMEETFSVVPHWVNHSFFRSSREVYALNHTEYVSRVNVSVAFSVFFVSFLPSRGLHDQLHSLVINKCYSLLKMWVSFQSSSRLLCDCEN